MGRIAAAGLIAFLFCAVGPAFGDGMLLLPSQLSALYTEQSQLAVIEIGPDRVAMVHLFISLKDDSGRSRELQFVLPLQAMPKEFRAQDVTGEQFRETHLAPLDKVFRAREQAKQSNTLQRDVASISGAVIAGPFALVMDAGYSATRLLGAKKQSGVSPRVSPAMSVETAHSRTEVYRALRPEELATLAKGELSEALRKTIRGYAGRPFALVRLRTVPAPKTADLGGRIDEQGVDFVFTQDMIRDGDRYRYDFPLGTGAGWANPISFTEICVTGGSDLNLRPTFPGDADVVAAAADRRQVHMASYIEVNPQRDARVELLPTGKSECVAERDADRLRTILTYAGSPLVGGLVWLLAVRLTLWRSRLDEERSFWRLAAVGGLHAWYPTLVLLAVLTGFAFLISLASPSWPAFLAFFALVGAGGILARRAAYRLPLPGGASRLWAPVIASGLCYLGIRLVVEVAMRP